MSSHVISASELLLLSGADVAKCMQCGRCSAACPAATDMDIRPHQLVARLRSGDVASLLAADAPWQCLSCFCCSERCPREVKPARVLEAIREAVLRQQGNEPISPDDIPALLAPDTPQQLLVSAFRKYR